MNLHGTSYIYPRACAYQQCNKIMHSKYCDDHKHIQSDVSRETRGTTSEQGYGTIWQKVRKIHLLNYPLCEDCKTTGIVKPAKEVHHKIELRKGGTNEDDNLQSLCKSCHSKRTRMSKEAIGLNQSVLGVENKQKGGGG